MENIMLDIYILIDYKLLVQTFNSSFCHAVTEMLLRKSVKKFSKFPEKPYWCNL